MKTREPAPARTLRVLRLSVGVLALALLLKMILFARVWHYGFVLGMPGTLLLVATLLHWIPRSWPRARPRSSAWERRPSWGRCSWATSRWRRRPGAARRCGWAVAPMPSGPTPSAAPRWRRPWRAWRLFPQMPPSPSFPMA